MLTSRIKTNTNKSSEYYGEGSIKLSILHTRQLHQCRSLNSDIFRIHITNESQWHCGSPLKDSNHYVK